MRAETFSIRSCHGSKSTVEKAAQGIFTACGFFAVLAVASITLYMLISGTPALFKVGILEILFGTIWQPAAASPSFGILYVILTSIAGTFLAILFGTVWQPAAASPSFGILFVILTSIVGTFLAILIGVPIGVMTAIFLAEVAPKRLSDMVRPAVELLAGIPSVIYGLLGILILNPLMYKMELILFKGSETHQFTGGANLISAVLVLALMILPTVINISESALRSVPAHLKSASLALGATKIQTIFQVIVPAAKSGIITAVVLGTGRAIGEAMAISLVSGSSVNLPLPFSSVRFLTTAIVSEMGYASGLHRQVLFTIGLVLFAFIMIINISLTRILKRGGNRNDK